MNYLVVRLSSLGDILHTVYMVSTLKGYDKAARITWVVEEEFADVLSVFSDVDEIFPIRFGISRGLVKWFRDFLKALKQLRSKRYDVVIDVQGLLKSAIVTFFARSPKKVGFSFSNARELSYLFYNRRVESRKTVNILEKNHLLAEAALSKRGLLIKDRIPVVIPKEDEQQVDSYLEASLKSYLDNHPELEGRGAEKGFILINPWSAYYTKELPLPNLEALLWEVKSQFASVPILMCGPKERQKAQFIAEKTDVLLQPPTTLIQLFALIRRSSLYVGCDSGPSFISVLLGKKTLILFGPTNAHRQAPSFGHARALYSSYQCPIIKEEPITTPYRCKNKKCPNPLCMKTFDVKKIAAVMREKLEN